MIDRELSELVQLLRVQLSESQHRQRELEDDLRRLTDELSSVKRELDDLRSTLRR